MILQAHKGLNSRQEAIPFDKDGFLPLITAPMYSVVDETNYQVFLNNKVHVCLPRGEKMTIDDKYFSSVSLQDFNKYYINAHYGKSSWKELIDTTSIFLKKTRKVKVCIDTANGNMPQLHEAIRKAKELHGDSIIIMAGNVGSENAFLELAKTGVDYIRVGIGGGAACNTTANTGVGQHSLGGLIWECNNTRERYKTALTNDNGYRRTEGWENVANVKIVADGISSYIKFCQEQWGFYDNGYAAINTLLYNGADLVMIGSLFTQCLESAGEKGITSFNGVESFEVWNNRRLSSGVFGLPQIDSFEDLFKRQNRRIGLVVKLQGMSTKEAQKKYRNPIESGQMEIIDFQTGTSEVIGEPIHYYGNRIRPSEGKTIWVPVRWTLNEWLYGNGTDELPGFVNMLKSAMAYLGATKLEEINNEFKS